MGSILEQLDALNLGEYVGFFHETPAEQRAVIIPFFKRGLARGERCVYLADELTAKDLTEGLWDALGIPPDRQGGPLLLLAGETSPQLGQSDPAFMLKLLRKTEDDALAEHFAGVRLVVEMTRALESGSAAETLVEWKALGHSYFVPGCRTLALCQYDRRGLSAGLLLAALRIHPTVIVGDRLGRNLYHEPPTSETRESEPKRVEWMMAQLRHAIAAEQARADLYAASERRRREAEALADLGRLISRSLDPTEVAQRIADSVRTLLRARNAALFRLEAKSGNLAAVAVSGEVGPASGPDIVIPPGMGAVGLAARTGEPVATANALDDDRITFHAELRARIEQDPFPAVLAVPLVVKGRVIGVLRFSDRAGRVFDDDETRLAMAFADHAAIAQEISRLHTEAKELAVSRERERLASELHDTLSQMLFSTALKVDWCLHRLPRASETRVKLEEIRHETGVMMGQIRRLISKLSREESPAHAFPKRLRALIAQFRELTGISVDFDQQGDAAALDQSSQEILEKVFQEALANVAKHARATRVTIRLLVDLRDVRFEVADDGVGPPPRVRVARLPNMPGHFGLHQMRERITAMGGRLELRRNVPSGFRLSGTLPTS